MQLGVAVEEGLVNDAQLFLETLPVLERTRRIQGDENIIYLESTCLENLASDRDFLALLAK